MLRAVFAMTLTCFLFGSAVAAGANKMLVFKAAAFQSAMRSGGPILVETYSSGCPVCWIQEPTVRELIQKPEYSSLTVFVIDVDGPRDTMRMVNAQMKSTLIVFKNGTEVGRLIGVTRPSEIENLIRKVM